MNASGFDPLDWHRFRIQVPPMLRDALCGRLAELGSSGSQEDGETIIAFFAGHHDAEELEGRIRQFVSGFSSLTGRSPSVRIDRDRLANQDWNAEWKRHVQPVRIDCGITIVPAWLAGKIPSEEGRHLLVVDPGSAFGTGHHETTSDCLCAILEFSGVALQAGSRFCDFGTGTGILALLAARLGFDPVVALDIDSGAVQAARDNAGLNGVADRVQVLQGGAERLPAGCGMIVANLLSTILVDAMPKMVGSLNSGGLLVLSGMLEGQEVIVQNCLKEAGLELLREMPNGRWRTLLGRKP